MAGSVAVGAVKGNQSLAGPSVLERAVHAAAHIGEQRAGLTQNVAYLGPRRAPCVRLRHSVVGYGV